MIKPHENTNDVSKDVSRDVSREECCAICLFSNSSCICQSFWKDFTSDFSIAIESTCDATPLRISTITTNFKIKNTFINLTNLSNQFKRSLFMRHIKFRENSKKSKKDLDLNYNFYNQCSITSYIPRENHPRQLIKVSIKVFHNGSFNITGCRSIRGIVHVIRTLVITLFSYKNVLVTTGELRLSKANISMINTDFSIGYGIKQKLLNKILQSVPPEILGDGFVKRSEFEPDEYHGVKIKYVNNYSSIDKCNITRKGIEKLPGELTISVFNTGSIIITGGKTSSDTMGAYKFINKIFDTYKDQIMKPISEKIKKKKKLYYRSDEMKTLNVDIVNDEHSNDIKIHNYKFKSIIRDIEIFHHKKIFVSVLASVLARELAREIARELASVHKV